MNAGKNNKIVAEAEIKLLLDTKKSSDNFLVTEILAKALELKGLSLSEVAHLLKVENQDLLAQIFSAANKVKEKIYGKRLVLFAPLYLSNLCANECSYCAFRAGNKSLPRRFLSPKEIALEVKALIQEGQKRLLLVAGEANPTGSFQYFLDSIATVYQTKTKKGEIRRVNVNLAPLEIEEFKLLKQAGIGTYQLFQETYNRKVYRQVHKKGKKADYDWRISVFDRAFKAGIDDVGLGVLFGLSDWRFEVLALLQHALYLEKNYGVGPHTISVPRIEPAFGSDLSNCPPQAVSDLDFYKIIAILRLAMPYTGIILSTRENEIVRRNTFLLGVSQVSAGSRTNPGGYSSGENDQGQFSLGDHRSLEEVIQDIVELGYLPSFCTACYRSNRTGKNFMKLAKPGKIGELCTPNALFSFNEYLLHFAKQKTKTRGKKLIDEALQAIPMKKRKPIKKMLDRVEEEGDVFF
jgi:2-iminoacetate synthase